jgi:hypothetical protein
MHLQAMAESTPPVKGSPGLDDGPKELIMRVIQEDLPIQPLPNVQPWEASLNPESCTRCRGGSQHRGLLMTFVSHEGTMR